MCGPLDALADGVAIKRPIKKVLAYPATCVHSRCVVPRVVCPDGYSCFSLYGGDGAHGGEFFLSRDTNPRGGDRYGVMYEDPVWRVVPPPPEGGGAQHA